VVSAAGVTVALLLATPTLALAAGTVAGSGTTTTTVPAPCSPVHATTTTTTIPCPTTTTTTAPRPTTTTTKPAPTRSPRPTAKTKAPAKTTTTTRPPTTTTTTPKPPAKGVPKVPVGAPHFPPVKPGSPPPDPTASLQRVQADLAQLTAIDDYAPARAAIANSQQAVSLAATTLQAAVAAQSDAQAGQQGAQKHLDLATARVRSLAVSAYMGLGFLTPAAGPQPVQDSNTGTVNTPGGLNGPAAIDALEMLRLVGQRERHDLQSSRVSARQAAQRTQAAARQVAGAQASLRAAQSALSASTQTLALVTRAATTPGLAASLGLFGPAVGQSTTGVSLPTGPAAGLSAAAAPVSLSPTPTTTIATLSNPAGGVGPAGGMGSSSPTSPSILGPSVLSGNEMARWFASTKRKAHTTVPITQLANDYATAGQQTHVRADLAFAQSIVETGFFSFPSGGQLTPKDNNFAGIGACDSCAHGWRFSNALIGVTAQMQLLDAYASPGPVLTNLVGDVGIGGCCPTWMELAGTWASSLQYGISIMTIYHQMLAWVIPQRLIAAGLLAPPRAVPARAPALAGGVTAQAGGYGSGAAQASAPVSLTAQPDLAAQAVRPPGPSSPPSGPGTAHG
jgi:hypothetical protein